MARAVSPLAPATSARMAVAPCARSVGLGPLGLFVSLTLEHGLAEPGAEQETQERIEAHGLLELPGGLKQDVDVGDAG